MKQDAQQRLAKRLRKLLDELDDHDLEMIIVCSGTETSVHIRPQKDADSTKEFGIRVADTNDDFGLSIGGQVVP